MPQRTFLKSLQSAPTPKEREKKASQSTPHGGVYTKIRARGPGLPWLEGQEDDEIPKPSPWLTRTTVLPYEEERHCGGTERTARKLKHRRKPWLVEQLRLAAPEV